MTFGFGRNCLVSSVSFHCYGHSIAVPIGSCCKISVNNSENLDNSGYLRDTEFWCHVVRTSFRVSHTVLLGAGLWVFCHSCEVCRCVCQRSGLKLLTIIGTKAIYTFRHNKGTYQINLGISC